jgi:hypothetical protein
MERVTEGRTFTPHGIEDIIRKETGTVVGGDCQGDGYQDRESQGDNYKYSDSIGDSFQDRDSSSPLNLSNLYNSYTDSYGVGTDQRCRKLAPLAPPVPDKPHLVGQNAI